jgi:hypothetical protein
MPWPSEAAFEPLPHAFTVDGGLECEGIDMVSALMNRAEQTFESCACNVGAACFVGPGMAPHDA